VQVREVNDELKHAWLSRFSDALAEQIEKAVEMGPDHAQAAISAFKEQYSEVTHYTFPLIWAQEKACTLLNLDYATLSPKTQRLPA